MSLVSLSQCAVPKDSPCSLDVFTVVMACENYFRFGTRSVFPITCVDGKTVLVESEQIEDKSPLYIDVFKVVSYATIIFPLLAAIVVLTARNYYQIEIVPSPLDSREKRVHDINQKVNNPGFSNTRAPLDCDTLRINTSKKECKFDKRFKQVGSFSLCDSSKGEVRNFNLHKVGPVSKDMQDMIVYAPFDTRPYHTLNCGWLKLQPSSTGGMCLCSLDNSCYDFSRPSRKDGKFPGMGSALVQFAIEKSIEAGFDGKVWLISTNSSWPFYAKLGFKTDNPEVQRKIERSLRFGEETRYPIDGIKMHLPEESIIQWKEKIARNPISKPKPENCIFAA